MSTQTPHYRKLVLIAASLALAGLSAWICGRLTSLDGLPDIGEPFDVEEFSRPIPDETNAYVLYRQAAEKLTKEPPDLQGHWETAGDRERAWLLENRETLEIWRRGTDRPDALNISPRDLNFTTPLPFSLAQRSIARLVTLEGTRLESEGKYQEAIDWYLALLRASRHVGQRASAIDRLIGVAMHSIACKRLTSLAAKPEVESSEIRRALDTAIAVDARTPADTDYLKCEYLAFEHTVADPASEDLPSIVSPAPAGSTLPWHRTLFRLKRALLKEPERSRRVFRLIVANNLSYGDLPPSQRPPMATSNTKANIRGSASKILSDLYAVDSTAPESARALSPEELARWFDTTIYAELCMPYLKGINQAIARERSTQANLLISLANALYERDHGEPPDTIEELVGPYLKSLPEGAGTGK